MTHTQDYERADGHTLRLTYAEPDGAVRGGLVVLHEANGVTDDTRLLMDGLAVEGWLAAAPHVAGSGTDAPERPRGADVLAATDRTLTWLGDAGIGGDLLGVVGFDLGGTAAMVVAAQRVLGAVVTVGGLGISESASDQLPALVDVAGSLTTPWLGIYGDTGDETSASEVRRLQEAAADARVATNVVRYPGTEHRFDANGSASDEAWERTLAWFDAHLR